MSDNPRKARPPMSTSATLTQRAELLRPVESATERVEQARRELNEAIEAMQTSITEAADGGVGVADLCRATELSRGRIYQIIDKVHSTQE